MSAMESVHELQTLIDFVADGGVTGLVKRPGAAAAMFSGPQPLQHREINFDNDGIMLRFSSDYGRTDFTLLLRYGTIEPLASVVEAGLSGSSPAVMKQAMDFHFSRAMDYVGVDAKPPGKYWDPKEFRQSCFTTGPRTDGDGNFVFDAHAHEAQLNASFFVDPRISLLMHDARLALGLPVDYRTALLVGDIRAEEAAAASRADAGEPSALGPRM